jgi:hypothetical protein
LSKAAVGKQCLRLAGSANLLLAVGITALRFSANLRLYGGKEILLDFAAANQYTLDMPLPACHASGHQTTAAPLLNLHQA